MSGDKVVAVKLNRPLEHAGESHEQGSTVRLPQSAAEFVVSNGGGVYVATRNPKEKHHG